MEGKGDSFTQIDFRDVVNPITNHLPAGGRSRTWRTKTALAFAGFATVLTSVAARCNLPPPFGSSDNPQPITSPSSAPSGPDIVITPTPSSPGESPSPFPSLPEPGITLTPASSQPETSPTLSPTDQLTDEFAAYTGGVDSKGNKVEQTNLPDNDRFYTYNIDKSPAQVNIIVFGVVNTDYTQPVVEPTEEGYLLDTREVKASNGKNYLIADMVQESVKAKNGSSEQYILPVNLGCVDPDSKDIDALITGRGIVASESDSQKLTSLSPSEIETQLKNSAKQFVLFTLDVVKDGTQGYQQFRDPSYTVAQNAVAKDAINFGKSALTNPFDKIPKSKLLGETINQPVENGFDVSTVPMSLVIVLI